MSVVGVSVGVPSTDRHAAVRRYERLLGAPASHEFPIPGRALTVTLFPGPSLRSGTTDALAPVPALRAIVFVDPGGDEGGWRRWDGRMSARSAQGRACSPATRTGRCSGSSSGRERGR